VLTGVAALTQGQGHRSGTQRPGVSLQHVGIDGGCGSDGANAGTGTSMRSAGGEDIDMEVAAQGARVSTQRWRCRGQGRLAAQGARASMPR